MRCSAYGPYELANSGVFLPFYFAFASEHVPVDDSVRLVSVEGRNVTKIHDIWFIEFLGDLLKSFSGNWNHSYIV